VISNSTCTFSGSLISAVRAKVNYRFHARAMLFHIQRKEKHLNNSYIFIDDLLQLFQNLIFNDASVDSVHLTSSHVTHAAIISCKKYSATMLGLPVRTRTQRSYHTHTKTHKNKHIAISYSGSKITPSLDDRNKHTRGRVGKTAKQ
jgi:hypothetical protein